MTTSTPQRVSVIIPTCKRSAALRQALASVRAIDGADLDLDVIVADNGSAADTERITQDFGARLVKTQAVGAAAARNAGLRAATGDFIAFLDDDDVWLSGQLRSQLKLLANRPDFAAAVGQVVTAHESASTCSPPWPVWLPTGGDLFLSFLKSPPQIGATVVRAEVLGTVGHFDATLLSSEDWDWHLRLALLHAVGFVDVPCVRFQAPALQSRSDDLYWMRSRLTRQVFWLNVRRAAHRRLPWHALLGAYRQQIGLSTGNFMRCASAQLADSDYIAARRSLRWALQTSPLHVGWAIMHDVVVRRCVLAVLMDRPARSSTQETINASSE